MKRKKWSWRNITFFIAGHLSIDVMLKFSRHVLNPGHMLTERNEPFFNKKLSYTIFLNISNFFMIFFDMF